MKRSTVKHHVIQQTGNSELASKGNVRNQKASKKEATGIQAKSGLSTEDVDFFIPRRGVLAAASKLFVVELGEYRQHLAWELTPDQSDGVVPVEQDWHVTKNKG